VAFNTRHAVPAMMLAEEQGRLHPLPAFVHTLCFGQTRNIPTGGVYVFSNDKSSGATHQPLGRPRDCGAGVSRSSMPCS
jgi:hypothetical protein